MFCIISVGFWYACENPKAPTEATLYEASEQPPVLTKQMVEGWRSGGDLLAKSLALALNDPLMSDLLRKSLTTNKRKSILFSNLLKLSYNGRSVKSILANRIGRSVEQFDRILADASPEQVDEENWVLGIDFPVNENFEKWLAGESAWVLLSPWWIDEKDVTPNDFYAFDRFGEIRLLDIKTPPNEPTLVITPILISQNSNLLRKFNAGNSSSSYGGGGSTIDLVIDETIYYHNSESGWNDVPEFNTRLKIAGPTKGSWEKVYQDYIDVGSQGCGTPNHYLNDKQIGTYINSTALYRLKLYEDDNWPNPDDLCATWDIYMKDFAGFGVSYGQWFTDGTNCNSKKNLDLFLYLRQN